MNKILLLTTVILLDILSGAEVDLFVPSFPEIKDHFNVSTAWLEALLSANYMGSVLSLFFVGGLADRMGRKPIILIGLLIFIIGSSLCSFATNYSFLLIGRFLQGIGISAPAVLCFLIIADNYPIKKQQYYIGMLNGLVNVAVAGAPVFGSYITMYYHFKGNFIALLIFGILAAIMTMLFVPMHNLPEVKEPISLNAYIPIFKSKPLMLLIINTVFMFVPYWIFLGLSPILYIKDLGVSLKHYGYYQGAWALIFAVGCVLFGLIIEKFSTKRMLYISAFTCLIGSILIAMVAVLDIKNPLVIALSLMIFNIGSIIPFIIIYPIALNYISTAKGKTSALIKGAMLILTTFGTELAGYCYQGSFQTLGIIISFFILVGVITLFLIIKNREINRYF
jgi:MFS transporter, DHA1 family, multidrug resistance protein